MRRHTSVARISVVFSALVAATACTNEHGVTTLCGTEGLAFDIEEASVLQDAQSSWNMHDAVILEFDTSQIPDGARWRVSAVEIMPTIGASEFDAFADGQTVGVEVWDADNPLGGQPWRVDRVFHKDPHEWDEVYLPNADSALDPYQKFTWWKFDFEEVIPVAGMVGPEYLVGVVWVDGYLPAVGYSNFNRSCALNWTDYADGYGWVLNSDNGSLNECSWPMMKVYIQIIEEATSCENGSVAI